MSRPCTGPAPRRRTLVETPEGCECVLRRNLSMTPAQFGVVVGSLALVSLVVALVFAARGAWLVVPFAGVEITALGLAFLAFARHAGDGERIVVRQGRVTVECSIGGRISRFEGILPWVRVEYGGRRRELVRLAQQGRSVAVGRFVPEHERADLATALRAMLAAPAAGGNNEGVETQCD